MRSGAAPQLQPAAHTPAVIRRFRSLLVSHLSFAQFVFSKMPRSEAQGETYQSLAIARVLNEVAMEHRCTLKFCICGRRRSRGLRQFADRTIDFHHTYDPPVADCRAAAARSG